MTTQNQVVNVNVRTSEEKKRRKRKKRGLKSNTKEPYKQERMLQASADNSASAPKRPYLPMTSYIASPYNNGLVPEVFNIQDITQQTLMNMRNSELQQLEWEKVQTAKIKDIENKQLAGFQGVAQAIRAIQGVPQPSQDILITNETTSGAPSQFTGDAFGSGALGSPTSSTGLTGEMANLGLGV
jgi:hypothetical protein